ncbi:recombinase family protein [Streptomyces sp. NPDC091266]|uniref:recombinase family protein n=1 Tax=Streptomyces sp. NPDC091266 TaxID=3365978 RepID=UPI003828C8D9
MAASTPQRAGIYCRLSYAPDGSLEKVERQEADCRELATRLGWPVSDQHVFPDNSRSAWQRNRKRPQWDRMLSAIEAGEIDAIIIYHGDRLIRQPHDLEKLIGIAESKGIRIASPSGTRDLDSPDDRFILRIEAAQACRESDNTSRRVRRALEARAQRGLTQVGGRRPFGFGVQIGTRTKADRATGEAIEVPVYDTSQHEPREAKYAGSAADRLLAGQSQGGVLRWLAEAGVTTTEGNPFTSKSLRNVLLAPRIAGLVEYRGVPYEAAWPAIISRETQEALKLIYRTSAEAHPYPGRERKYLLSGNAECYKCHVPGVEAGTCQAGDGKCQSPHATVRTKPTGGRNRKDSRIYFCPVCKGVGRNLDHLDAYVSGVVLHLLNDPRFLEELHEESDDNAPSIRAEITALERRKAEAREQLENLADLPEVNPTLVAKSLSSFDRKITELRDQLAATSRDRLLLRMAGITQEQWGCEPVDVRASTVRALFRVVILPTTKRGPGFDPSSVRMERRRLTDTP